MIRILNRFPRNGTSKRQFSLFRRRLSRRAFSGKLFIYEQMRNKIPNLLIFSIERKKKLCRKMTQKMDFAGVEIAWVDEKSNKYP